ncbi:MAG: hypothetical protein NVS2B9_07740 [Myxococcales bacterium]
MRWHWQLISEHIGDDFAYTVHLKTTEPPPGARDKGRQELRVTQIYRHDNGKWKIVHRHADTLLTTSPPPEQP